MGGISTKNFRMFRKLCGESTLKNVAIVTNMWGEVSLAKGEAREKELASRDIFFKPVLDKEARLLRHDNTLQSAQKIISLLLKNKPNVLEIQRELVDQGKIITDTAAGTELNRELAEQQARHRQEIAKLGEDMRLAMKDHDEHTRRELEAEQNKLKAEVERIQFDAQNIRQNYERERENFQRAMAEEAERARAENAQVLAEYQSRLAGLQSQLQHRQSQSNQETARLRQEMQQYQDMVDARQNKGGGFLKGLGKGLLGFGAGWIALGTLM